MYQLLIDRSSLWLLLACLALAFVLIFFGGLVVGLREQPAGSTGATASPSTGAPVRVTASSAAKPAVTVPRATVRTPTVSQPAAPRVTTPQVTAQAPSTPTPTAAAPSSTATPAANGAGAPFAVQVGAYRERQFLEEAKTEIEVRGYTPEVQPDRDSAGRLFYRLLVGSYETREEAQRAADEIEAQEGWAAFPQRRRDS